MSLKLAVEGTGYEGWITANVERGLDNFAWGFDLTYLDRWSQTKKPWPILADSRCVLSWKGEQLIDGLVKQPSFRISGDAWDLRARGYARPGELVNCSAVHKTGFWKDKTATEIATDLCAPFEIKVTCNVPDTKRFPRFAIQEGETVHSAIDRMCKIRALLPRCVPSGDVELFAANADSAFGRTPVLMLDVDKAIDRTYSNDTSQRFSEYRLRATGTGETFQAEATVQDSAIKLYRPLVVVGDAPARTAEAKARAQWEANVRSGRGERFVYTFQDPTNLAGRCYSPGQRYKVNDPYLGVDATLMVANAAITVQENDQRCVVQLVHPEAYSQFAYKAAPLVKKSKKPKKTERGNL